MRLLNLNEPRARLAALHVTLVALPCCRSCNHGERRSATRDDISGGRDQRRACHARSAGDAMALRHRSIRRSLSSRSLSPALQCDCCGCSTASSGWPDSVGGPRWCRRRPSRARSRQNWRSLHVTFSRQAAAVHGRSDGSVRRLRFPWDSTRSFPHSSAQSCAMNSCTSSGATSRRVL